MSTKNQDGELFEYEKHIKFFFRKLEKKIKTNLLKKAKALPIFLGKYEANNPISIYYEKHKDTINAKIDDLIAHNVPLNKEQIIRDTKVNSEISNILRFRNKTVILNKGKIQNINAIGDFDSLNFF